MAWWSPGGSGSSSSGAWWSPPEPEGQWRYGHWQWQWEQPPPWWWEATQREWWSPLSESTGRQADLSECGPVVKRSKGGGEAQPVRAAAKGTWPEGKYLMTHWPYGMLQYPPPTTNSTGSWQAIRAAVEGHGCRVLLRDRRRRQAYGGKSGKAPARVSLTVAGVNAELVYNIIFIMTEVNAGLPRDRVQLPVVHDLEDGLAGASAAEPEEVAASTMDAAHSAADEADEPDWGG